LPAVLCAVVHASHAGVLPAWQPAPPRTEMTQQLDEPLPLDVSFVDADAHAVRLRDYFGDARAVVLVLGYHRCPNLCGLAMHGLLEALAASGLPRRDYRVLVVSVDPTETPADARARRDADLAYAAWLAGPRAGDGTLELQRLVGPAGSIAALAHQAGFAFERDTTAPADSHSRYAHPAGLIVVTPAGRTSRYFPGVRFDAGELREALVDASAGRIGGPVDRLLLLCAHFDPALGRHDGAVMNGLRAMGLASVLALGAYAWRHRRQPAPGQRP
jgi:protein SCO1/2